MKQLSPRIHAKIGDITQENVCAVVNAANSTLLGGGGVDGAIHRAGGPTILEACRQVRATEYPDGLPTGEAVITTSGNMPSRYVVHTVGPVYGSCGSQCAELLASCYKKSIVKAVEAGCDSIAFPAISTGVYGYPKAEAAVIALKTVKAMLVRYGIEVIFVFRSEENYGRFLEAVNG